MKLNAIRLALHACRLAWTKEALCSFQPLYISLFRSEKGIVENESL